MTAKRSIPLERINVASPCKADWNKMLGNDQVRFCSECQLNVYNLSNMTREQAENLVQTTEGKLCVRFYRRTDGTVISQDCPVGLKAVRQKVARIATAVISATFTFLAGFGLYSFTRLNISENTALNIKMPSAPSAPSSKLYENKSNNSWNTRPGEKEPTLNIPDPISEPDKETPPTSSSCYANIDAPVGSEVIMGGISANVVRDKDSIEPLPPSPPTPSDELKPATPSLVRRSEGVLRGNAINKVTPDYPALAKTARVTGEVIVEITIGEDGNVASSKVISGHPLLQQAALRAARQWQFKPVLLNNIPVKVQGNLTFRFTL
jgi:TonB family protein